MRLQIFGDLLMMIRGAVGGLRTLVWSGVLIAFPVYAVALGMRETVGNMSDPGDGGENFTSVPKSFNTVFRCIVAGDCSTKDGRPIFLLVAEEHGWVYNVLYMLTFLFMVFGLFNVIVAIYVENTVAAAKYNEIYQKRVRLQDEEMLAEKSAELIRVVWDIYLTSDYGDPDARSLLPEAPSASEILDLGQVALTPTFLEELLGHRCFTDILFELDVADEDQVDLFETLDVDGGGTLDLVELVVGISSLRGSHARRADVISVRMMLRHVQQSIANFESRAIVMLTEQASTVKELQRVQSKKDA